MAAIVKIIIQLLAGVGVGMLADKVAPDANLNATRDIVQTVQEDGSTKFDYVKILKWVAITIAGAFVANMLLKIAGFKNLKLF